MQKRAGWTIWTSNDKMLELRDLIYMQRKWRNSTQSFEGRPLDTQTQAEATARLQMADELSIDDKVAFICDDPDYAVFSSGLPILWHSRTTARKNKWVAPFHETKIQYGRGLQSHIEIISALLNWLNEAECDDQPVTHMD